MSAGVKPPHFRLSRASRDRAVTHANKLARAIFYRTLGAGGSGRAPRIARYGQLFCGRRRQHVTDGRDLPIGPGLDEHERSPHVPRLTAGKPGEIVTAVSERYAG